MRQVYTTDTSWIHDEWSPDEWNDGRSWMDGMMTGVVLDGIEDCGKSISPIQKKTN